MSAAAFRGAERLPAHIALSLIPSLPRPALERLVQRLIDGLDDMDPDSDLEPDGDEEDGVYGAEDEFVMPGGIDIGPGCPVSDPGEMDWRDMRAVTHDGEDQTVIILPAPRGIEPCRYRVT
jgi:hypothetical protein